MINITLVSQILKLIDRVKFNKRVKKETTNIKRDLLVGHI